jgi:hypothetical protein
MFQGSYRYRPVTQLSPTKKPLRHPSVIGDSAPNEACEKLGPALTTPRTIQKKSAGDPLQTYNIVSLQAIFQKPHIQRLLDSQNQSVTSW